MSQAYRSRPMSSMQLRAKWYPELLRFPSTDEARLAERAWWRGLTMSPRFWVFMVVYTVGLVFAAAAAMLLIRRYVPMSPSLQGGLVGGLVGGCFGTVTAWTWRRACRRFLRERLVEQGVPICNPCGYDLRRLTEPRCPECGAGFAPALLRVDTAGVPSRSDTVTFNP